MLLCCCVVVLLCCCNVFFVVGCFCCYCCFFLEIAKETALTQLPLLCVFLFVVPVQGKHANQHDVKQHRHGRVYVWLFVVRNLDASKTMERRVVQRSQKIGARRQTNTPGR